MKVCTRICSSVNFFMVAAACFALQSIARGDDTATFDVQLIQPLKVGDRVRMHREIDETLGEMVSVGNAGPLREASEVKLVFSGALEALAVDGDGVPTRWKVKAEVATVRQPGTKSHEELVKPGTEFIAEWNGGKVNVSAHEPQHPLSELATKFLPAALEAVGGSGEATLNRILRPTNAVAAGASWKIDTKAAVEHLHRFDSKLKPADVAGTARLKALTGDAETKDLIVEYEFTAKSKNPTGAPHGMTSVGPAVCEESGSLTIPADHSTGYLSAKTTTRIAGLYKKSETEKKPVRVRTKTINKSVNVEEHAALTEVVKASTILTYERVGGVNLPTPSSTSTPPASSSDGKSPAGQN